LNKNIEMDEQRALELHKDALVVDMHSDTFMLLTRHPGRKFAPSEPQHQMDLSRLMAGGVDVVFFTVSNKDNRGAGLTWALKTLDRVYREAAENADKFAIVLSKDHILNAKKNHQVGAFLICENGLPYRADLSTLRMLYRLGVRSVALGENEWTGRSCYDRSGGGLTDFGVEVVKEMNRLGMVVDVAHLNEQGFWDVAETSQAPFIDSHANCRALCDHPRNLKDDQIKALAEKGGLMGIVFYPPFVSETEPSLSRLLDHLDHIIDLVGPECAGIGSDFDGISGRTEIMKDVSQMPRLTAELARRGYSEEDIKEILGGNFLRVLGEVESCATHNL
jgi:membrane dipeptidase